jgi:hypothetical protein
MLMVVPLLSGLYPVVFSFDFSLEQARNMFHLTPLTLDLFLAKRCIFQRLACWILWVYGNPSRNPLFPEIPWVHHKPRRPAAEQAGDYVYCFRNPY